MKQRKRKSRAALLVRAGVLEDLRQLLYESNQKLDYLIRNLRRFNGNHNHLNHTLTEFMG